MNAVLRRATLYSTLLTPSSGSKTHSFELVSHESLVDRSPSTQFASEVQNPVLMVGGVTSLSAPTLPVIRLTGKLCTVSDWDAYSAV